MKLKFYIYIIVVFVSLLSFSATSRFDETYALKGLSFQVSSNNNSSINNMTVVVLGLTKRPHTINLKIEGTVTEVEVGDLNRDGFPELYIYIHSAGSGNYGSVIAYSSNKNKSLSPIYFMPLNPEQNNKMGYMGHDDFSIIKNQLVRRFPHYSQQDTNDSPSGKINELSYELVKGEASWQLKLANSHVIPISYNK